MMRMSDHTIVTLDLAGLPATTTNLNVYAVDPLGKVTALGPLTLANGAVTHTLTTPLDKFMIFVSPEALGVELEPLKIELPTIDIGVGRIKPVTIRPITLPRIKISPKQLEQLRRLQVITPEISEEL